MFSGVDFLIQSLRSVKSSKYEQKAPLVTNSLSRLPPRGTADGCKGNRTTFSKILSQDFGK